MGLKSNACEALTSINYPKNHAFSEIPGYAHLPTLGWAVR
jgi:hypothetical protein